MQRAIAILPQISAYPRIVFLRSALPHLTHPPPMPYIPAHDTFAPHHTQEFARRARARGGADAAGDGGVSP